MTLMTRTNALMVDQVMILSTRPDRFRSIPLKATFPSSVEEAVEALSSNYHRALFLDAVLPRNQSAYRAVKEIFQPHRANVGQIFIMLDEVGRAHVQFALTCGADGVIPKDQRSILRALQSPRLPLDEAQPADPFWLPTLIQVARQFLASEAEHAVRECSALACTDRESAKVPDGTIRALAQYFDDQEDYFGFAQAALKAMRSIK